MSRGNWATALYIGTAVGWTAIGIGFIMADGAGSTWEIIVSFTLALLIVRHEVRR